MDFIEILKLFDRNRKKRQGAVRETMPKLYLGGDRHTGHIFRAVHFGHIIRLLPKPKFDGSRSAFDGKRNTFGRSTKKKTFNASLTSIILKTPKTEIMHLPHTQVK